MRSGRRLCAVALVAALVSGSMRGEPLAAADETSPANVAAARRHFDRARAYYAQGAYREAISEFEAAHALDPNAKDLVFNLGVVHEKLADIDDALKWFRLYASMNITEQEREKANAYLRRLEGAKKELDAKQAAAAAAAASGSSSSGAPPPPPPPEKPQYGRIDAFTIAAASVAVVGLGTGTVLGIKAAIDKPPANQTTGLNNLSYQQLESRTNQAHNEAIGADIAFGVGIAAAAVTAYLYLARPRSTAPSTTGATTTVSAAPLTGGGAFFVQGSF
jgi:tetratricopeptide (TPR) repeat protein